MLQAPASQMGDRHLPRSYEFEERFVDEAPPRYRRLPAGGLVHAAPHPRSVEGSELQLILWPSEVDETYFGGKARNMHAHKRKQVIKGRGPAGKTAVIGAKDRATNRVSATVIDNTDQLTLQGFVAKNIEPGAKVYTDDHRGYAGLPNHETVRHSVAEYVKGQAHTNGIESFWATLKRAHKGVFHKMSPKHLQRYVSEFAGKHNVRNEDTLAQMVVVATGLVGKRLMYRDLVADNGLSSGAHSR